MLSVQSPGYAGMERFGVDAGLGSPPNHRRKMRSDSVQAHNLLLSADSSIGTNKSDSHSNLLSDNHHRHYCHLETDGIIRCPHHVPLPDSEWHPPTENNFHNRNSYQQAEITRSYIRPPPNKSALDVPYHLTPSDSSSTHHSNHSRGSTNSTTINNKSKHNPLAKFLMRISAKSNENSNQQHHNQANCKQSSTNSCANQLAPLPSSQSTLLSSCTSSTSSSSSSLSLVTTIPTSSVPIGSRQSAQSTNRSASKSTRMTPPPSYVESQIQYQLDQQQHRNKLGAKSSSTTFSLRTPSNPSINSSCSGVDPSPKINKSRSLCNDINYTSLAMSTTPTTMINSIVNNTAHIGSSSPSSSIASSIDELISIDATVNNQMSAIEFINLPTDLDINCLASNRDATATTTSSPTLNHV